MMSARDTGRVSDGVRFLAALGGRLGFITCTVIESYGFVIAFDCTPYRASQVRTKILVNR